MTFDAPGRQELDPNAAREAAPRQVTSKQVAAEMQAPLDEAYRRQEGLRNEIEQDLQEQVPGAARLSLQELCDAKQKPELFSLALTEAAKLPSAVLSNPQLAGRFLAQCVDKAEIAALDAQEQQLDRENAALNRGLDEDAETIADVQNEREQVNTSIDVLSDKVGSREDLVDLIERDEALKGLRGEELLNALASRPEITQNAELAQYIAGLRATLGQMRSVGTNPQERATFENILATASLNLGADNQSAVFADVMAQVDASEAISEETKTRLRHISGQVPTGTDVDDLMDAVDPETGKPVFAEGNQLQVRDGLSVYVKPDGSRRGRVEVEGVGVREIPWEPGERGETIGLKLSQLKMWMLNEASGSTDFMGETVHIDTSIRHQTDPERLRRTQLLMSALFGGTAGFDGEIVKDEDAKYAVWFNQFTAIKGDAAIGDFDRSTALTNRTDLGFHPGGDPTQLDYEVIRAASLLAKGQYGSGNPDYFALQRHLNQLFPARVPLTGENKEPGEAQ